MSNARNLSSSTDNRALELPISSSSTSTMTSFLSSSAATESKEEKEANGREEKHNTSDDQHVNDKMPGPIHNIILDYLGYAKLPTMTGGGSSLFHSIKKAKIKTLITAIVSGDHAAVNTIIDENPSLLLESLEENDSITSPSGQKSNNVTPFRAALAVEDTQMAALIKKTMIQLYAGHIADQQYLEQFPQEWEAEENQRWAPVFEQLETLTQAIRHANREEKDITSSGNPEYKITVRKDSAVANALAQFRLMLNDKLNETVTTGRHYNPHLLLQACRTYEQHYADYFGNDWDDPRALLFWQQVIGTIQRGLPVNYVQAFCDGLHRTEEKLRKNTPQGRSLTLELYNVIHGGIAPRNLYPLSRSRLGFEWAWRMGAGWLGWRGRVESAADVLILEACVNQKQRAFRNLCPSATFESLQRLAR